MGKTYNGRFDSPPEPKGGGKMLVLGLVTIPLWSIPVLGLPIMAGSICCYVKAGKMYSERKMYRRFHEFSAVIGMRERVPFKDLMKASSLTKTDLRQYLLKMISRGYFGQGTYVDLDREELILPAVQGGSADYRSNGDWWRIVTDVMSSLRSEDAFCEQEPVRESDSEPVQPQEKPAEKPAEKTKASPAAAVKKVYMDELERTLAELHTLNEQISDENVSARIDRIGMLAGGIFRAVIENPEREQDVRKFMNYYLPTTLKLLKSYDMLEGQSYQGENIIASRKKIESVLDMLIEAFEKQLDRLFTNDALDIATDIDVLETMMAGDGLSGKFQMKL